MNAIAKSISLVFWLFMGWLLIILTFALVASLSILPSPIPEIIAVSILLGFVIFLIKAATKRSVGGITNYKLDLLSSAMILGIIITLFSGMGLVSMLLLAALIAYSSRRVDDEPTLDEQLDELLDDFVAGN